ncbi:helix-turn-helix domain-containing protein [Foetidibacter luteolus]|uniref:helix-turn-helix domain-containing protein n=1 Tax=Foetidibacter luteolus TaxID=2608880 RepID=UPI00129A7719|nr:helix-turn-helix domain-containing protein [Foetidibacter luteolus]
MTHDPLNKMFALAADFIQYSNRSVFLTGKAGTGKTTFLKYIRQSTIKQTAVVAPTGVAAINAGGVTIHSFFQLPFTPFTPGVSQQSGVEATIDRHQLLGRIRITRERRQVLQQLELLVIDEISMVRCDVLDAIDTILRHFRHRHAEPFGGVQVLFIGDMFQLPPVVPEEEWRILSQFYNSPYFFDSKVIGQQPPVHIELDKIYRQNEQVFIDLLNKVRNNQMDEAAFQLLNSRYDAGFTANNKDGYIILTTHNYKADNTNAEQLDRLKTKAITCKATINGEFSEKAYPADETLLLKTGAQVMFIKNDMEKVRRYYNGKIGVISSIDDNAIHIQCKNEPGTIEVKKEKWENIRYSFNQQEQRVDEEVIGTFEQYPLRLAWAITIHKSQGLTFEKAVIDAGAAFAPGQVYVALSRCTTLSGIVLKSHITSTGLINDRTIVHFAQQKHSTGHLADVLLEAKRQYQSEILKSLFGFGFVIQQLKQTVKTVEDHSAVFNPETGLWLAEIETMLLNMQETAGKFQLQLTQLLLQGSLPEENEALQQRVKAASDYFSRQLQTVKEALYQSPAVTDSKQYALAYNEDLKDTFAAVCKKYEAFRSCLGGFKVDEFYRQKNAFVLPDFRVNAYAAAGAARKTQSPHPVLHRKLRELRDAICREDDSPVYFVASSDSLDEMARYLPQTPDELQQVTGFGKAKTQKIGGRFLAIINEYCDEQQLTSLMHEKQAQPKKEKGKTSNKPNSKADTKEETYKLFKEGKTIGEIAAARNLTNSTIEGHLAFYVEKGIVPLSEIIAKEKLLLIQPLAENFEGGSITPLKEQLGENISYGEIRLVLAGINFKKAAIAE